MAELKKFKIGDKVIAMCDCGSCRSRGLLLKEGMITDISFGLYKVTFKDFPGLVRTFQYSVLVHAVEYHKKKKLRENLKAWLA